MAFYVPSTSNYRKGTSDDDEKTTTKPIGKSNKSGFYIPSATNYLKVYEQQEEEKKKQRIESERKETEKKKLEAEKPDNWFERGIEGVKRAFSIEGAKNVLGDVKEVLIDAPINAAQNAIAQAQMGQEGAGDYRSEQLKKARDRFADEDFKSGEISQEERDRQKKENAKRLETTQKKTAEIEKKFGRKYDQDQGAIDFVGTALDTYGLTGTAKAVFENVVTSAQKRLGRDLTKEEVDGLAERTSTAIPDRQQPRSPAPEVTTAPLRPTPSVVDDVTPKPTAIPEIVGPRPAQVTTPDIESTIVAAARTKAEERLGRPLTSPELDNLTQRTKQLVTDKFPLSDASQPDIRQTTPTKVETPGMELTEGDTISGNAARIESFALEKKLTEKMGDLPQYKSLNMKEQADEAVNLVNTNRQEALDIIDGKANPPGNLRAQSVHQALEDIAVREGDGELLTKLAKSNINTELSESAQNLRIAAERDPHSAVEQIRQIRETRAKMAEKRSGTTVAKAKQEIRKKVESATPKATKQDWNSFVKGLTC